MWSNEKMMSVQNLKYRFCQTINKIIRFDKSLKATGNNL